MKPFFIFIFLFSNAVNVANGQQLFKASVLFGQNFSQVDGDYQLGYDRRGTTFGVRGAVLFRPDFDVSVEMLYSEKGTSPTPSKILTGRYLDIKSRYAEIPLLLNTHFSRSEYGYYRWTLQAGVSYGRMLKSEIRAFNNYIPDSVNTPSLQYENFNTSEFSIVTGASYQFLHRFSLNLRSIISFQSFFIAPPARTRVVRFTYASLRNYLVSVTLSYDLFAPKLKKMKRESYKKIKI